MSATLAPDGWLFLWAAWATRNGTREDRVAAVEVVMARAEANLYTHALLLAAAGLLPRDPRRGSTVAPSTTS